MNTADRDQIGARLRDVFASRMLDLTGEHDDELNAGRGGLLVIEVVRYLAARGWTFGAALDYVETGLRAETFPSWEGFVMT